MTPEQIKKFGVANNMPSNLSLIFSCKSNTSLTLKPFNSS